MTDGHLFSSHDDRDFPHAAGVFEHRFEVAFIGFHIDVLRIIPVRRPGVGGKGSTGLSIDNNLFRHDKDLHL